MARPSFADVIAALEKIDVSSCIWEPDVWKCGVWEKTRFNEVLKKFET